MSGDNEAAEVALAVLADELIAVCVQVLVSLADVAAGKHALVTAGIVSSSLPVLVAHATAAYTAAIEASEAIPFPACATEPLAPPDARDGGRVAGWRSSVVFGEGAVSAKASETPSSKSPWVFKGADGTGIPIPEGRKPAVLQNDCRGAVARHVLSVVTLAALVFIDEDAKRAAHAAGVEHSLVSTLDASSSFYVAGSKLEAAVLDQPLQPRPATENGPLEVPRAPRAAPTPSSTSGMGTSIELVRMSVHALRLLSELPASRTVLSGLMKGGTRAQVWKGTTWDGLVGEI